MNWGGRRQCGKRKKKYDEEVQKRYDETIDSKLKDVVDAHPHIGEFYTSIILNKLSLGTPHGETGARTAMQKENIQIINDEVIPFLQDSLKEEGIYGIYISPERLYKEFDTYITEFLLDTSPIVQGAAEGWTQRQLTEKKKELMEDLTVQQVKMKTLQAKMNNLLRSIQKSRPHSRRSRGSCGKGCKGLQNDKEELQGKIEEIQGKIKGIQGKIEEIQGKIEETEQNIDRINQEILEHEGEI